MIHSLLSFVFPPSCTGCGKILNNLEQAFCDECLAGLNLLNPDEHCCYCFEELDSFSQKVCLSCKKKKHALHRLAAVFPYQPPASHLVTKLKYGNQGYLAQTIASFLIIQWSHLKWPTPQAIVPVPISFTKRLDRGFNQTFLIAQAFGEMMNVPVKNALKRSSLSLSQAGLSKSERALQSSHLFSLKQGYDFKDRVVLLLDDVITTGKTIQNCAEILLEGHPAAIYALAFCRTF